MTSTFEADAIIDTLGLRDQVALLGGSDFWHFNGTNNGIVPRLRTSDGPNGVRGTRVFNGTPSSCFPCATGLGASFDTKLIYDVGVALGEECVAKSAHCHLAPTVNIQRSPLGGRGFESFSEDPHLNGMIGSAYVNGVQSTGVASTPKHYVGNDQEFERFSVNSVISDRALREIYLEPFRLLIKHSSPRAIMSAYNRVNGTHVSESVYLLDEILKKEWGFEGLIMSDWTGVYSVVESIKAGLDVEMPGAPVMRDPNVIQRLIASGKLSRADIRARALSVLKFVEQAQKSGIPFDGPEKALDSPERRALLRRAAADSVVLLKNSSNLLPLTSPTSIKSIAVIGTNARMAAPSGGGSATVLATYTVSPLEGIEAAAKNLGIHVRYSMGPAAYRYVPLIDSLMTGEDGKSGAVIELWKERPAVQFVEELNPIKNPDHTVEVHTSAITMTDGLDEALVGKRPYIRFKTNFTPDISGDWEFGLVTSGLGRLFLDGKLVVDNTEEFYKPGEGDFGAGSEERRGSVKNLQAGHSMSLEVRSHLPNHLTQITPFTFFGLVQVGASRIQSDEEAIAHAVKVATQSDVAVVVVGTNKDWESEGFDRKHMKLPGHGDELVKQVLMANLKTVVVVQSGMPCELPFVDDASTIVQAFFGGNEGGNGIADVLFGVVNPSGRLPLSFPKHLEDNPAYSSFGNASETPGQVVYNEGIYVGYRLYDKTRIEPQFAFGHGLSYTTFDYSDLVVSPISKEGRLTVSCNVKNTGTVTGREVVQVYVEDTTTSLSRPIKELAAFTKVTLPPGSSEQVSLNLDKEAFSFWHPSHNSWIAEQGEFKVHVAASANDVRLSATTSLEHTFTWRGL